MRSDRRSFLKTSSVALASMSGARVAPAEQGFDPSFAHHVLFWMRRPEDRAGFADIVGALREFRTIAGVRFVHVGAPTVSEHPGEASVTDATYTISYLVLFESKQGEEAYLAHPLYASFFERFKDAFAKIVIYDSVRIEG